MHKGAVRQHKCVNDTICCKVHHYQLWGTRQRRLSDLEKAAVKHPKTILGVDSNRLNREEGIPWPIWRSAIYRSIGKGTQLAILDLANRKGHLSIVARKRHEDAPGV
jgi:hypothetical protein